MKVLVARVLAGLIALLTISSGILNIFTPEAQVETAQLLPQSVGGWSNFRVGMGAPFLAAGLFAAYAAIRANTSALIPVMVFFACVLLARLVGFAAEGLDPRAIRFSVLALVMILAAFASHRLMQRDGEIA